MQDDHRQKKPCRGYRFRWRTGAQCLFFVLLFGAVSSVNADTLKVGSVFPNVDFLHIQTTTHNSLASLSDVQEKKAIVFVFASW